MKKEGSILSYIKGIRTVGLFTVLAVTAVCWSGASASAYAATLDSQLVSNIAGVSTDPSYGFFQPLFGETSGHSDTVYGFTLAFGSTGSSTLAGALVACASPADIATETCFPAAYTAGNYLRYSSTIKEEKIFTFSSPYTLDPSYFYYIYSNSGYFTAPPDLYYGSTSGVHFYDSAGWACGTGPHDRCPYSAYYQLFGVGGPDAPPSDFTAPATTTPPCTQDCNDNVLFLPGIEGSRLYAPGLISDQVWEPIGIGPDAVTTLDMSNSSSANNVYARDKNIIDTAYFTYPVYTSLIAKMNSMVANGTIVTWEPIVYDWRLDYQDLINYGNETNDGKIYYHGSNAATSTPYIVQELKKLAASSRTGKVTIIAHSNGALVAKELTGVLGPTESTKLIDKIIFVAVPQLGTPQAIGALLHGYDQGLPRLGSLLLSSADARNLAQKMPLAYNLLPSPQYFNQVTNAVITFDTATMADWKFKYTGSNFLVNGITSDSQLRTFMTDDSRTTPGYYDLATPSVVSPVLFDNAVSVHTQLDSWTPPSGVQMITIAGWGNETLSTIEYKKEPVFTCLVFAANGSCAVSGIGMTQTFEPKFIADGDGTVIDSSAQWANSAPSVKYWVNLMSLNQTATSTMTHANILEIPSLLTLLTTLITNSSTSTLPQFISTSRPSTIPAPRLHFTLHSPLTLGFTDAQGKYTGSTGTTTMIFGIPGVEYQRFGEIQLLSVPKGLGGTLTMHGIGTGSFTLNIAEVSGNTTLATTTFAAIPSATSTSVTMPISPTVSPTASGVLNIDYDGNGTIDSTYRAKKNGVVLPDITPPITSLTIMGIKGSNGWYKSNLALTFHATDPATSTAPTSGVAQTFFSIDNTATSSGTTTALMTEGTHIVRYYSTDKAGNQESIKVTTINIDQTAPEATFVISTNTKDIVITGLDTLSSTTVSKTATSTTITDKAGNTAKVLYQKTFIGTLLSKLLLTSVQYGTSTPLTLASSFTYTWATTTKSTTLANQTLLADATTTVKALYATSTNKTTISVIQSGITTQTTTLTGLIPIRLSINKGGVNYLW